MIKFTSESGIYQIKNIKNGKSYIGSAVNLQSRISKHKWELNKNIHHSNKLQRSWNRHGKQYFIFCLVEIVPDTANLIKAEQFWIDLCDSYHDGYNCCPIAGSALGRICSEETRAKMSVAQKGKTRSDEILQKMSLAARNISDETRAKMRLSKLGKKHTDESKAKMSASLKLRPPVSEETKSKARGRIHSKETKAKMSESAKNKPPISEETRTKMSEVAKNREYSKETRAKMSIAQKNKTMSEEAKEKIRLANTGKHQTKESIAKGLATRAANKLAKL